MIRIMKASAGSGKTYNLAKTYIRLLLQNDDRYAYRHILAVTFTNKATEEMKSRILKELHILATDPAQSDYHDDFVPSLLPSDAEISAKASRVLRDILHDYSAFAVSTIDRFFQQTLKAFSREIGQFASYQVELDRNSLVAESVDRVLDSLTEADTGLLAWLTDNVLEQIEQGGRYSPDANLLKLALRMKSAQRQEELDKAGIDEAAAYSPQVLGNIRKACRQIIADFRKAVKENAAAAVAVLNAAKVEAKDSNRGFMKALEVYAGLDDRDAIKPPTASFMEKAPDSEKWFSAAKAKALLGKVYPALMDPMLAFCNLWEKEYPVYQTAVILDRQIYGLGVARELSDAFKELMKEKNVLCIDDSNVILRDIIDNSDAPFIYEKIGVRFDHFLLDEFQDTSSVQWTNFSPLLKNSDSQGHESLIVGDIKQSIYRWRGSDWKLLADEVPATFPDSGTEVLDTNYRSLKNVVTFNNEYFKAAAEVLDGLGGEKDGRISHIYSDVEQEVSKLDMPAGSVSITFCPKEEELQKVLESVQEAVAAGARLSEIAVLVRSNATGESVAGYLIDNGFTVVTDDSLNVKSAVTVRRLVSLLSYVDNPENTVNSYLAEVLDIKVPDGYTSLIDMAESVIRELKASDADGVVEGEILHVQSFMDHLQEYVANYGNNLRGFLKYWEDKDPSISSPSSGDSVRVMTIHKSKGLDFPYVIIPFAENITLFKADSRWCSPDLSGTQLEGVAEGVYDVYLSQSSESTLFSEHYKDERFLQQVDNINTIYVAMTRAALGMHVIAQTPAQKCQDAIRDKVPYAFTDFSQILYWFVAASGKVKDVRRSGGEGFVRFDVGEMVDFTSLRKEKKSDVMAFRTGEGGSYPSFALNPEAGEDETDVRERGRLKFSADSLDFFSADGDAGISASNRIRGVVLHDILSSVVVPEDLDEAVDRSLASGEVTPGEAEEIRRLLADRIAEGAGRGWFPDSARVLNETSLIDVDGSIFRPDRVVVDGNKVVVIDYKSGEHRKSYERQLARYADIWRRMGYEDVSSVLWYVHTGEYVIL
ncbi:MAG: UvrD-helicase domain-containing protein [Bacteroidales bacterium]|nr:UvrD-helicase domain-containing protein [Bacteroidales bacterium]